MSSITRPYTFSDGTTMMNSRVEAALESIVSTFNKHDQGILSFTSLKAVALTVTASEAQFFNAVTSAFRGNMTLYDSAALAAGVGGQIAFGGKYTGSTYTEFASIQGAKKNATDANLNAQLILRARSAVNGMQNHIVLDGQTGSVTQPIQPSFLVTNSAGATDVTGDATVYTVVWGNEIYDQGGNFSGNTFTAPVDGRYLFTATVSLANILAGHTGRALKIVTSNRNYTNDYNCSLAELDHSMSVTCIADMDAGDTATVTVDVSGSTKTIDISASGTLNYFSGSLIN